MNEKIYGGIYKKWPNEDTMAYIMSPMMSFVESRLTESYLIETIAHNHMLFKSGIVPKDISIKILSSLLGFYKNKETFFDSASWDIHENCEKKLREKIGEESWWFHVARSRNDQSTTDQKIFMKTELLKITDNLNWLCTVLLAKATEYNNTIMPGYTHLRIGTPSSFGFYLQSYLVQILECQKMLQHNYEITDISPLWAGNSYGVNWPIDTNMTAKNLGFAQPFLNSLSAINSRWIHELHMLAPLLSVMLILSRMMEDIIIWSTEEFGFLKIAEDYTTGSSIMPQKMNPDIAEKVRSKIAVVAANFNQIIYSLKWTSSWYNRDSAETKTAIVNSLSEIKDSIKITEKMLDGIVPCEEFMKLNLKPALATKLADFLVSRFNIPFRTAHKIIGSSLSEAKLDINALTVEMVNQMIQIYTKKDFVITQSDFDDIFTVDNCLYDYTYQGTPNPDLMLRVNEILSECIESNTHWLTTKNNVFYASIENLMNDVHAIVQESPSND